MWKDIPGIEPYQISTRGEVKGYGGKRMKPYLDPHGYYSIRLRKDGKYVKKYIHRLIGECFIENPGNMAIIDHVNRDKSDNRIENLRWCSITENNRNSARHDNDMYGIYWYETRRSYLVKLKLNNTQRYIGWKRTLEEAKLIRDRAKREIDTELNRPNELPT